MSDIFVKTAGLGSTGWRKAANLFVKTAGLGSTGWRSAIGVWIKTSTQWLRVWPLSGVFATRTPWIGEDSTTAYADRLTSSGAIRIGSNYYGNNAQWDANGWTITSYEYQWRYYSGQSSSIFVDPDGTIDSGTGSGWTAGGTGQDLLPTTIWTSTNSTNMDRKYLSFRVVANASNSTYNGISESVRPIVVRRPPLNLTTNLSDYTPELGVSVTYSSTWDTSEARKAESARTTIQWYRSSTATTSGGTYLANTASYTPVAADVGNYLYVVETRYNSGTDYDYGLVTGSTATVITTATVTGQRPGAVSSVVNYNFTTGTSHLFLTTGTNTTSLKYSFISALSGTDFDTSEFTRSVSSSTAYQFTDNLINSFNLKTWNEDTYSAATTYFEGNTAWYAGNNYTAKAATFSGSFTAPTGTTGSNTYWTWSGSSVGSTTWSAGTTYVKGDVVRSSNNLYTARDPGFFGQVPTNTSFWTRTTTVNYFPGDYILRSGTYYFAKSIFNGFYPTNTGYWFTNYFPFTVQITPYNGITAGDVYNHGSTIFISPNTQNDFVRISSGPTISNITQSQMTATYLTSIYTNRVVVDVKKGSPLSSISGYPYTKSVSGATEYTETPTGLTSDTTHNFYLTPRYRYTDSVFYDGITAEANAKTLAPFSAPTISGITFTSPNSFSVAFTGGSGPYYQIFWNTSGTAPSNTNTLYDAAGSSSPIAETLTVTADTTYYFWIRSSTQNIATTTSSGNATAGTFSDWSSSSFSIKPLARPTSLSATSDDKTKIRLTWSGGAGPNYQVYWTTGSTTKPTDLQASFDFSAGSTSPFDWTGMSRGTTYYFYIRSNISTTVTNWFPTAAPGIIGRSPYYKPGVPTSPSATASSSSQIDLSWTAPTTTSTQDSAESYDIYYSTTTTDPTSSTSATTTSTTASKSITGLTANTDYYFWVRAANTDNTGTNASAWTARFTAKTSAAAPVNTAVPNLSTNTTDFRAGSVITVNAGTWTGASSYKYELIYGSATPLSDTSSATRTLNSSNQYTISTADASSPSYYFKARVTAYSGASQTGTSTTAYGTTSARSYISNPSTTIAVSSATSNGFTISGTVGPIVGSPAVVFASISEIQIWNSSQTSIVSTITTGLPAVNATTGAWSYTWTGGAATTQYYAKAVAKATDSAGTTATSVFSSAITTLAVFTTPNPGVPASFVFSRNLNGGTSTTRRNWFWNVSSGIGSYSYVIYDLYVWDQTTQPTTTGITGATWHSTFGTSTSSAPVSNAQTYNLSGTTTPIYRTMARGSSYNGSNSTAITTRSTASWGKARCRVTGTNGTEYTGSFTAYE
jgi:hypothetical protein